jgi:hypothetical protein
MRSIDGGGNVVDAIGRGRRYNDQQRTFYIIDMKLYSTLSSKLLHDDLRLHTLSLPRGRAVVGVEEKGGSKLGLTRVSFGGIWGICRDDAGRLV